jgi:hypothetical protein
MRKLAIVILSIIATASLAQDIDERTVLALNEMQRHHILTEMRALLLGTQQILQALSEDDMLAVARHARMLGTDMAHTGEKHLQSVLPDDFMQLGKSVHKSFDQIAADAETLKDSKHTLAQLSMTMQSCVACHAAYQIRTSDLPAEAEAHPAHHKHH